jgi:hypothetical protein
MHPFGDPGFPKKNLTAGAFILAFSSYQVGASVERLIWSKVWPVDYVFLALWVGLLFVAIKMFRVGLAAVPPDPNDQGLNQRALDQRTPGYWIRRVLFWIVLVTAPVAIIQFCARVPNNR